jgi:hypothetical protein
MRDALAYGACELLSTWPMTWGSLSGKEAKVVYGVRPFAPRSGIVTNELIDRLREDDAY